LGSRVSADSVVTGFDCRALGVAGGCGCVVRGKMLSGTEFRWVGWRMFGICAVQTKKKPRKPEGLRGKVLVSNYFCPAGTAYLILDLNHLVAHACNSTLACLRSFL